MTDIPVDSLDDGERQAGLDNEVSMVSPPISLCPECHCVLPPRAQNCLECGAVIFIARAPIKKLDGELIEFEIPDSEDKQYQRNFMAMLRSYGRMRGYAKPDGFAAHQFLAKFGHWPNDPGVRNAPPTPPDRATSRWIKARQIAYYEARKATARGA